MRTGIANLPLHPGKCPRWLFPRMSKLGGAISEIIVHEYGHKEYLKRLSDPYFFQALGCVLGFDWHSSGLTTTVCGALKESVNSLALGITFAGGKGRTSKNTLVEIENSDLSTQKIERLKYSSRMSAKVDSALVQDGYQLYHHSFVYTEKGDWAVIQQGLSNITQYARRYHWLSDSIQSFVDEPHSAICCDFKEQKTLNLTARESFDTRKISLDLVKDNPKHLSKFLSQKTLTDFYSPNSSFSMTARHRMVDMDKRNLDSLQRAFEFQPQTYEELVSLKGIGPKTVRSLALISELVYGSKPSWEDPVKYSFALGGKDKIPYEINKDHYDKTILILKEAVDSAKIGDYDRLHCLQRLRNIY